MENEAIEKTKTTKTKYEPIIVPNGDTIKQLLARSRYILYKNTSKWTLSHTQRAKLLFELYPDIEKEYQLSQDLRNVFENTNDKIYGLTKLAKWHEKVAQAEFKSFNTISRSIQKHY
jgi:hypothetical protein